MFYEVIPTKIFHTRLDAGVLTYTSELSLQTGHLVRIPLGRQQCIGIVSQKVPPVDFPCKAVTQLLDPTPLPSHLVKSIFWLSAYYLCPLPTAASLILPIGVDKKRRALPASSTSISRHTSSPIPLNSAQRTALRSLQSISSPTKLLHGVTGSGKTHLYLQLTANALAAGQSVILLVPEISLTTQLVRIFTQTFPHQLTLIHSRQTESARHQTWLQLLHCTTPQIVIGPRSALFAPLAHLGLILIDEAHDPAYFQENTPKYSAVRLASYIASLGSSRSVILGTATPLVTDYYLASHRHSLVTLQSKAKPTATSAHVHLIDLTDRTIFTKNRYFADPLLQRITHNLEHHHQTLIFHNRRGTAPLTLCQNCGWQALCPTCFLPLTLHTDAFKLICHTCGYTTKVPPHCPSCGHLDVIHKGFGTKLLESELKKLFPHAQIARFDADNTKTHTLDQQYDAVKNGEYDIIVGTQTIAKGLDLPLLATVGVVQADAGLALPDYSTEERTFHLITQVIGRVGRGHLTEAHAYIQTYQPHSPVIQSALSADYASFYQYIKKQRQKAHFPPFTYLAKLSVTYKTERTVLQKLHQIQSTLRTHPQLQLSQPTPAFHEHTSSGYTWQIIIKCSSRQRLLAALRTLPANINYHLALDPPSLL